jgi:putative drug exporter of the RND superfamily
MNAHGTDVAEARRIAHSGWLARFAGTCARHPWRVIGSWVVIIVALIGLNAAFHGELINDFKVPGTDFQKATDLINAKFGAQKGAALRVVIAAPEGQRLDSPANAAVVEKLRARADQGIKAIDQNSKNYSPAGNPLAKDAGQLSQDGRIAFFDAQFDQTSWELKRADIVKLEDDLRAIGAGKNFQVEFTGEAEGEQPNSGTSELLGIIAAFFVLLILFRALVPTFIPIIFAIVAVVTAFLLLYLGARLTNFNTVVEILVPMIGLGVGIDYTLFIVTRFRQFLHDGLSPEEAAAAAGATAGRAVIFAGLTVAISITGLALIGIDFITKLGLGSALGVVTAVCLANSLLPAVLSKLGHKVDRWRLGLKPTDDSRDGQRKTWVAAWGRLVTRRNGLFLTVTIVLLLAIASPVLKVRLGLADSGTAPKQQTTRQAYDLLSQGFGPGFTSPIPTVVDMRGDHQAPQRLADAFKGLPGVARVVPPIYNAKTSDAASVAIINVYSKYKPQDQKTDDIVSLLRKDVIPKTLEGSDARAYVSGQNAAFTDIGDKILSNMPWFLLYVIGVTFVLLAMAFRSLVIAAKASITTLASALVGFGALTLTVQLGHGLGVLGLDRTGPIESFVPPIAFAILFGLSMDYEVFLMSRIREEHVHGKSTFQSVRDGVAGVGRVIVAASLVMSIVFFAFILTPDRISKEFGILLGIAILTDALIIRMTLVPALLSLLGEKSWYMPAWLDRILPNLTIEPPATAEPLPLEPRPGAPASEPA